MFGSKIYIGGGSMPKPTLDRPKILLLLLLFNPSPLTSPPVMMPLHFTLLNNSSFLSPHGFAISFWCPLSRNAIQPHQQPCLGTSSCQKRRAAFKALETCPDQTAGRCQHAFHYHTPCITLPGEATKPNVLPQDCTTPVPNSSARLSSNLSLSHQ